ncbi:MAG: succinate dehydrogenase, hydrophobic membrane anchor protein [Candidatus Muproteobacteria bacterium RBG_16_60_9]|uniref:Succinate dehydrogenase hydrophobic membrane anchor subunit n=1 Tax=Candidatus Muproteobacteria bacterium RBG_16_60_9 TaxID=1817755 RepID=A0A1F6UYG3_9PROT|nr:MAG: succinate dehydrogenase, hydrophobic membrane anchor protein [Candidatus Muproteobacteria bacterium RBG_16_60_9]
MSSLRSLGPSHRGITAFLVQRITSLYLAAFTVYVVGWLVAKPVPDYAGWTAYFDSGLVRMAWGLFFASLLAHLWVGLRSIYMDYLKPMWLQFTISTLTAFGLMALALWCAQILVRGVV